MARLKYARQTLEEEKTCGTGPLSSRMNHIEELPFITFTINLPPLLVFTNVTYSKRVSWQKFLDPLIYLS